MSPKKRTAPRSPRSLTHAVFGRVPVDATDWQKTFALGDRKVLVDLTVAKAADATARRLDESAPFVRRLPELDAKARFDDRAELTAIDKES